MSVTSETDISAVVTLRESSEGGAGGERKPTLTLTRSKAAALCGISVQTFDTWVRKGIVQPALRGTRRWSRVAIERALAGELAATPSGESYSAFEEWKRNDAN
jgi:hypothetical protein